VLTLLIGGFWWEENLRGKRFWEETSMRLHAAGQPTELAEIIPPRIPDEENVAAAPIFAEVFLNKDTARLTRMHEAFRGRVPQPKTKPLLVDDTSHIIEWREYFREAFPANVPTKEMPPADEILHYFERWEDVLKEIHGALERPKYRRPHYDADPSGDNLQVLGPIMGFNFVSRSHAVALAAKGNADAYMSEVIDQLRLGRLLTADCTYLVGLLVHIGSDAMTLRLLQNCLPVLRPNDRQLLALQQQLGLLQLSDVKRTYRDEIVFDVALALNVTPESLKQTLRIFPSSPFKGWPEGLAKAADKAYPMLMACRPEGWRYADAAMLAGLLHDEVLPCVDEATGTILVSRMPALNAAEKRLGESAGLFSICRLEGPMTTESVLLKAAWHQAMASEAMLWCAVERFRLKNAMLPETLDELVPDFVRKLPCDPVSGSSFKYVKRGERGYLLYSIGWDGKDDGGVERKAKEQGDWAWASDPRLIVNPDEEKLKAEAEIEAGAKNDRAKEKAEKDAEAQKAMERRNAQFRAKEEVNKRERERAAENVSKKQSGD
jgi:hypothetical protein